MRASAWQILLVIVIILLLFGARRLPDLARGVAQSLNVFKKEINAPSDEPDDNKPEAPARDSDAAKDSPQ